MFLFFARQCAIVLGCCLSISTLQAQALIPGDLVIVGYNFTDPDEFSILSLVDLSPGTQFYVTDCGWNTNTSVFRTGEGLITYTVPASGIHAGEQIHYPNDPGFVTQGVSGFFGLSVAGDQLLIFQGSFATPQFLFGLTDYNGGWLSSSFAPTNQSSHLPPGLIAGETALELDLFIQSQFECAFPFSYRQEFLKRLTDSRQWIKSLDRAVLPIMGCAFDVLAVEKLEWTYKMEREGHLLLFISPSSIYSSIYSEILWSYYTSEGPIPLVCRELRKGVLECDVPPADPYLLVKPCRTDGHCEPYTRIDNYLQSAITCYQSAAGALTIELSKPSQTFSYELHVLDGNLIRKQNNVDQRITELQGLTPGFYILTVELEKMLYQIPLYIVE